MKVTVDINGKPTVITLTDEQIKQAQASQKFEWKYDEDDTCLLETYYTKGYSIDDSDYLEHGRYRATEEQAEASLLRNKRANRLEALVYQIQQEVEGDCYIMFEGHADKWITSKTWIEDIYPEVVLMLKSTADTICEMLNSGKFSLDGEL